MEAVVQADNTILEALQELIDQGFSYQRISEILCARHTTISRGLSARSIRRFCASKGIRKRSGSELDRIVSQSISEVGISYGRKMMTGHLLAAKGLRVSEIRVGESLRRVCPAGYAARRTNAVNRLNPGRYSANYFGHKLHLDQNEKLCAFGVTHVIARDGFSGKIVAYMTLPIKNNVAIYDGIFRAAVEEYGLWDQLRVDHGREFYLLLFVQEKIRRRFGSSGVLPYIQTRSTENLTVERMWPEVNHRVNYPVKRKLIEMEDRGLIDMEIPTVKFCVSFVSVNVTAQGLKLFVQAWNAHPVAGGGTPNDRSQQRVGTTQLLPGSLPSSSMAQQEYEVQGGQLTAVSNFGVDPLRNRPDLVIRRDQLLAESNPPFDAIFCNIVHGNGNNFKDCVLKFIDVTLNLEQLV